MNVNFKEYVESAVECNRMTKEYTNKICKILTEESPSDNIWYFRDGFFRVDVIKEDYDKYMEFIEDLIGCSYCHLMNNTGLTFLVSLSTLHEKL